MPRLERSKVVGKHNAVKRWIKDDISSSKVSESSYNIDILQQSNERFSTIENNFDMSMITESAPTVSPNYVIVDIAMLTKLFSKQLCSTCKSSGLQVVFGSKFGFCQEMKVTCEYCDTLASKAYTSIHIAKHQNGLNAPYDINCA